MDRKQKIEEIIRHSAAIFVEESSNRDSLITITSVEMTSDLKRARILFTVLPETKEGSVLEFLNRKKSDLYQKAKKDLRTARLPSIIFEIDRGEKHRQHIDQLLINE